MKSLIVVLAVVFGLVFVSCDNGSTNGGEPAIQTYEDLVLDGVVGDRPSVLVFSTTRAIARAVLEPQTGDTFVMRFADTDEIIIWGAIQVSGNVVTFITDYGPPFRGYLPMMEGRGIDLTQATITTASGEVINWIYQKPEDCICPPHFLFCHC